MKLTCSCGRHFTPQPLLGQVIPNGLFKNIQGVKNSINKPLLFCFSKRIIRSSASSSCFLIPVNISFPAGLGPTWPESPVSWGFCTAKPAPPNVWESSARLAWLPLAEDSLGMLVAAIVMPKVLDGIGPSVLLIFGLGGGYSGESGVVSPCEASSSCRSLFLFRTRLCRYQGKRLRWEAFVATSYIYNAIRYKRFPLNNLAYSTKIRRNASWKTAVCLEENILGLVIRIIF